MDSNFDQKQELKRKISNLERQIFNINKMLKLLNDKDFDSYTLTLEASHEDEGFRDKQVVKFFDFSTLPEALTKSLPSHVEMLEDVINSTRLELEDLEKLPNVEELSQE